MILGVETTIHWKQKTVAWHRRHKLLRSISFKYQPVMSQLYLQCSGTAVGSENVFFPDQVLFFCLLPGSPGAALPLWASASLCCVRQPGKEQLDPPAAVQACKLSKCLVRRPFTAPSSQQQLARSWWRYSICYTPYILACDFITPIHSAYSG